MALTLEDVVKHGLHVHPGTAAEAATNRDLREKQTTAHEDATAKAARLAAAETEHLGAERATSPEAAWNADLSGGNIFNNATEAFSRAKAVDRGAFDKINATLGQARKEASEATRYAAWVDAKVRESDVRLETLKAEACDYICKEIGKPAYLGVVGEVDEALEALAVAAEKEARIRQVLIEVTSAAFPDSAGAWGWFTRFFQPAATSAFFGRAAGSWTPALNKWREHARDHGYKVRKPRDLNAPGLVPIDHTQGPA